MIEIEEFPFLINDEYLVGGKVVKWCLVNSTYDTKKLELLNKDVLQLVKSKTQAYYLSTDNNLKYIICNLLLNTLLLN